jgi:hypothetical protein
MPQGLLEKYEASLKDPKIKSQEDNLALIDSKIKDLLGNLEHSKTAYDDWKDIWDLVELNRKVLESEQKHLKDLSQMISIEELFILLQYIGTSIKNACLKYCDDDIGRKLIGDVTRDLLLCRARYTSRNAQTPLLPYQTNP